MIIFFVDGIRYIYVQIPKTGTSTVNRLLLENFQCVPLRKHSPLSLVNPLPGIRVLVTVREVFSLYMSMYSYGKSRQEARYASGLLDQEQFDHVHSLYRTFEVFYRERFINKNQMWRHPPFVGQYELESKAHSNSSLGFVTARTLYYLGIDSFDELVNPSSEPLSSRKFGASAYQFVFVRTSEIIPFFAKKWGVKSELQLNSSKIDIEDIPEWIRDDIQRQERQYIQLYNSIKNMAPHVP